MKPSMYCTKRSSVLRKTKDMVKARLLWFPGHRWGDTVNLASRMESHGVAGQIHVSEAVYKRVNTPPAKAGGF
jgi:hypothetical protein